MKDLEKLTKYLLNYLGNPGFWVIMYVIYFHLVWYISSYLYKSQLCFQKIYKILFLRLFSKREMLSIFVYIFIAYYATLFSRNIPALVSWQMHRISAMGHP